MSDEDFVAVTAADGPVAILFVDDEPDLLAGLRTSLRKLRKSCKFHFAGGGTEALAILAEHHIDVVVSDMRMPGMNGVELLTEVRANYPNIVRCILSGEAERELVIRAIPVTHRWLTKPCDRDELVAALTDAVRHRALLASQDLGAAMGGAAFIPSPPRLYSTLRGLLADDQVTIDSVAELVGQDPAISAKLLQWANSAFSSSGQPVTDLKTAVVRVGLSTITTLVVAAEVIGTFEEQTLIPGLDAETFETHVGLVSELAARLSPQETATDAHLGGLFSGVGLLLEASHLPERIAAGYQLAVAEGISLLEAERRLNDVAHPQLGAYLLSIWGLPTELVLLAGGSNDLPDRPLIRPGDRSLKPLEAVRYARLLAQALPHAAALGPPHLDQLDDELTAVVAEWKAAVELEEGLVS